MNAFVEIFERNLRIPRREAKLRVAGLIVCCMCIPITIFLALKVFLWLLLLSVFFLWLVGILIQKEERDSSRVITRFVWGDTGILD